MSHDQGFKFIENPTANDQPPVRGSTHSEDKQKKLIEKAMNDDPSLARSNEQNEKESWGQDSPTDPNVKESKASKSGLSLETAVKDTDDEPASDVSSSPNDSSYPGAPQTPDVPLNSGAPSDPDASLPAQVKRPREQAFVDDDDWNKALLTSGLTVYKRPRSTPEALDVSPPPHGPQAHDASSDRDAPIHPGAASYPDASADPNAPPAPVGRLREQAFVDDDDWNKALLTSGLTVYKRPRSTPEALDVSPPPHGPQSHDASSDRDASIHPGAASYPDAFADPNAPPAPVGRLREQAFVDDDDWNKALLTSGLTVYKRPRSTPEALDVSPPPHGPQSHDASSDRDASIHPGAASYPDASSDPNAPPAPVGRPREQAFVDDDSWNYEQLTSGLTVHKRRRSTPEALDVSPPPHGPEAHDGPQSRDASPAPDGPQAFDAPPAPDGP